VCVCVTCIMAMKRWLLLSIVRFDTLVCVALIYDFLFPFPAAWPFEMDTGY